MRFGARMKGVQAIPRTLLTDEYHRSRSGISLEAHQQTTSCAPGLASRASQQSGRDCLAPPLRANNFDLI